MVEDEMCEECTGLTLPVLESDASLLVNSHSNSFVLQTAGGLKWSCSMFDVLKAKDWGMWCVCLRATSRGNNPRKIEFTCAITSDSVNVIVSEYISLIWLAI